MSIGFDQHGEPSAESDGATSPGQASSRRQQVQVGRRGGSLALLDEAMEFYKRSSAGR